MSKVKTHSGNSISEQEIDPFVKRYIEMLSYEIGRLEKGTAVGMWRYCCYFGASTKRDFAQLGALFTGIYSGSMSFPERIRTITFNIAENNCGAIPQVKLLKPQGKTNNSELAQKHLGSLLCSRQMN